MIFARIEYLGLVLSVSDILAKAEEQVKSHSKKLNSQRDCCEYTPKTMPGSVFEKPFDCDDPLVISPGETPGTGARSYTDEVFLKYIKYFKNIQEN